MAKIVWTTEAERWLLKIHDYIAPDSPVNAFNVVKSIYLERFPLVGHAYRSSSGRDVRILLWGHYRIVYLIRPDDVVQVIGVFHGAMRFEEYLK